jgi:transaldolase
MAIDLLSDEHAERIHEFILDGHTPRIGHAETAGESNELWLKLRELGTELWLDTGSLDEAGELWTPEFSALTTNNTLLNHEVQKGTYDELVVEAGEMLRAMNLSERQMRLELAFILNARHALKLVRQFDAYVSVEEHTDLAHDTAAAVHYARRYRAICPERFIVKIPFTPAGVLATRQLSDEGVTINHTLGFAARQNYLITRLARPAFVNVFMGRLNSVAASNDVGDGDYVGDRATLASQAVVAQLRQTHELGTRQIGASFRGGQQVGDLAGLDVMTMPPKVARGFLDLGLSPDQITDRTSESYEPHVNGDAVKTFGFETLWDVPQRLADCVDAVEARGLESFDADSLVGFFGDHGCGDVLVPWTDEQVAASREEGKIPKLANWREHLESRAIGLDALMNLAGLNAFTADQEAMDQRVMEQVRRE